MNSQSMDSMDNQSDAGRVEALRPEETRLEGRSDETFDRIHTLTRHHLKRLAISDGGWSALYRDPRDGRLWEFTYPEGHLHGGGPPALYLMSEAEANEKYGTAVPVHS